MTPSKEALQMKLKELEAREWVAALVWDDVEHELDMTRLVVAAKTANDHLQAENERLQAEVVRLQRDLGDCPKSHQDQKLTSSELAAAEKVQSSAD